MNVDIFGSDFQLGARARFGAKITVDSTTCVDSGHLTANITIGDGGALPVRGQLGQGRRDLPKLLHRHLEAALKRESTCLRGGRLPSGLPFGEALATARMYVPALALPRRLGRWRLTWSSAGRGGT